MREMLFENSKKGQKKKNTTRKQTQVLYKPRTYV